MWSAVNYREATATEGAVTLCAYRVRKARLPAFRVHVGGSRIPRQNRPHVRADHI